MEVHVYVASENTQPRQEERWAGYLIRTSGHKVYDAKIVDETYHKTNLIMLVEALDRFSRSAKIVIHIQDYWVATMIVKNAETWQFNGWQNKKHEKVKNWQYWQRAYNKLQCLKHEGKLPEFVKMTPEELSEVMYYIGLKKDREE